VNPVPIWVQPSAPVVLKTESKGKEEIIPEPKNESQPKRNKKARGKGKKGKKEQAEATPTIQLKELKEHIDRLEQQLSNTPKKKTFKEALNTPAPKEKAQKEIKKEAERPKLPRKKDFEKRCANCFKLNDHFTGQCTTLPKGWIRHPKEKWDAMSSAEKRKVHHENSKLLPSYKAQSLSKHKPMLGSAKYHDNLIPIFNPNAGNSGVDKEFWGTMLCATQDKVQYVWITEHQLLPGVYYRGADNKVYLLPKKEEWTVLGFGVISQCRIHKSKLKLPTMPHLKVEGPQVGTGFSCLYIGLNPMTMQREFCDTPYSWSGRATDDVIHSASTANHSCGSFLYDSELDAVIASHHGTLGPDLKLGENNLCSPLKAMGPRQ
jgi:hypothetical protein